MNLRLPDNLPDPVIVALCDALAGLLDQLWQRYEEPLVRAAMAELKSDPAADFQADPFDHDIPF